MTVGQIFMAIGVGFVGQILFALIIHWFQVRQIKKQLIVEQQKKENIQNLKNLEVKKQNVARDIKAMKEEQDKQNNKEL